MHALILTLLIVVAVFLILLVLVQRGRGGGLAGALGGMGGQSAFGAKAGDTFTKVTMWTAFFWIVLCIVSVKVLTGGQEIPVPEGFVAPPGDEQPAAETGAGADKGGTDDATSSGGTSESAGTEGQTKTGTGPPASDAGGGKESSE